MNIQQALNVFNLSGELTGNDIKARYKKLALEFHPDRNPLGCELIKAVNTAFDFLMANIDKINQFQSINKNHCYNYSEELENVLNVLSGMAGVVFEVIGNWVWISNTTREHKNILKKIGCRWAVKKKQWFYRPQEYKSCFNRKEHSIDEIRKMYGTGGFRKAKGCYRIKTTV